MWLEMWAPYGPCKTCQALAGNPCDDMRWRWKYPHGFRWTRKPHKGREKMAADDTPPPTVRIETGGVTVELTGDGATPDSAFALWSRVMGQWRDRLEAGSFGFGGADDQVGSESGALASGSGPASRPVIRQPERRRTCSGNRPACIAGTDPCFGHEV